MSTQSLAVIRPFGVSTGPAGIDVQIITDLAPCFTVGTKHSGLQDSVGDNPALMLGTRGG